MTRGDGELPGTGFDPADPVEILSSSGAIMDRLRAPDGRWLMVPVSPFELPADWPTTPTVVAVIDSGVCDDHPSLVGRVIEQVDLTGEGIRDRNGHGTAVAAILAVTSPYTQIISIKAMNAEGEASVELLSHAIRIATAKLAGRGRVINISAGRRTPSCDHDCPLCTTVMQVQEDAGISVLAAAGNDPGATFCPAKSCFAVATSDDWSADGDGVMVPPNWAPIG